MRPLVEAEDEKGGTPESQRWVAFAAVFLTFALVFFLSRWTRMMRQNKILAALLVGLASSPAVLRHAVVCGLCNFFLCAIIACVLFWV